jgi:hypothetical protein
LLKRTTTKALVLALFASLAFTGAVAAKSHDGARGTAASHGPKVTHAGGPTTSSLRVKGNASHPGGVFRVLALVHAAVDLRPATVDAIVHFASGDVPAVLTRSGRGSAYHAAVPVPAGEPAGIVLIDATATVDGTVLTATGQGKIVVEDNSAPQAPEPTVAPSPSCVPAPSDSADPSESPEPSDSAEPSESPEPSDSAEPSASAEPSDSPEPSETAEPSDSPEPSDSADPSASADPCASESPTVTTTLTLPADIMAQVLAFLESLIS